MDEKALGKRLQLARKRAGLTQQELCQKAGLSYSTLAKIERGAIRSPSVFTVAHIASVTGTAIEDLLDLQKQGMGSPAPANLKKRSKSGATFVYMDITGTICRFRDRAFTQIAEDSHEPVDLVEILFWRNHDPAAAGKMSLEEFNDRMGKELDIPGFNWSDYYFDSIEPMPGIEELVGWIASNYKLGILSNNFPGITDELRRRKMVPDVRYEAVVDSSKVGCIKPDPEIYKKAQELASVDPSEILFIDNERPNLTEADRLGWQTLRFNEMDPEGSIAKAKEALAF